MRCHAIAPNRYHAYNQSAAEADIARWRADDLPIDIWGLDMDWRIWENGMEGKEYKINAELFPDMRAFYAFAHRHGLSVYMNGLCPNQTQEF